MLESELRIKAISEGYDPTIGIMRDGSDGSSKFVFDLMEPEGPKVEGVVLDFVRSTVFDPADFVIRSDGVCRLNPEMARMVVARVSRSGFSAKLIKIGAKVVSRGRYVAFQMAEVAIPGNLFADILRLIAELRPPPVTSTA